jgi:hypothetical protein
MPITRQCQAYGSADRRRQPTRNRISKSFLAPLPLPRPGSVGSVRASTADAVAASRMNLPTEFRGSALLVDVHGGPAPLLLLAGQPGNALLELRVVAAKARAFERQDNQPRGVAAR